MDPAGKQGTSALRVPPEILADILCYYQRLCHSYTSWHATRPSFSWITVTHVCRYWREVALGTPHLWTGIDISAPETKLSPSTLPRMVERTKLFLIRSNRLPLDIYDSTISTSVSNPILLRLVLPQIGRARSLHIALTTAFRRLLDEYPSIPTPLLTSLGVSLSRGGDATFTRFKAPNLQELIVFPCAERCGRPNWISAPFMFPVSLTRLVVHASTFPQQPSPTIAHYIQHLVSLEYLILMDVLHSFPSPRSDAPTHPLPMILPRLKEVHISINTITCASFLRRIGHPASTRVWLRLDKYSIGSTLPHAQFQSFSRERLLPTSPDAPSIDTLVLGCQLVAFHTGGRELGGQFSTNSRLPMRFLLSFTDPEPTHPLISAFISLVRAVILTTPLTEITILSVHSLGADLSDWLALTEVLPGITTLAFYHYPQNRGRQNTGWNTGKMLTFLQPQCQSSSTPGAEHRTTALNLPHLTRIHLTNIDFDVNACHKHGSSGPSFVDALRTTLAARLEAGCAAVGTLIIERCGTVDDSVVGRLKEFIDAVEWDRYDGPLEKARDGLDGDVNRVYEKGYLETIW
ncbi:hypothetical protein BXZ70DRAFT_636420 [Cristinia sonorae]|uniref:F-box domain-containing protein n=1 Tax=Cristinia sonorae TaxID=1940300 RepID=A0A8K0XKH6_9AGAR|nr:hypothetical protein BXZ70DRAFT_636420 [Cristinia sonorae]